MNGLIDHHLYLLVYSLIPLTYPHLNVLISYKETRPINELHVFILALKSIPMFLVWIGLDL